MKKEKQMKKLIKTCIFSFVILFCTGIMALCPYFSLSVKAAKINSASSNLQEFLTFEQSIIDMTSFDANAGVNTMSKRGVNTTFSTNSQMDLSTGAEEMVDELDIGIDENNYELKRLIVQGNLRDTYGAVDKASYNDISVLAYATEQDTENAYNLLSKDTSLNVTIDTYEYIEGYAEKSYNYSSYTNWGPRAADIGGYRQFLLDNNVTEEVVVVVMDTGINTSHPMFVDRLLKDASGKIKGYSYYDSVYRYSYNNLAFDADDTKKYSFEDDHGHGAHVAGIVCDMTPSNVKILPIKIGASEGRSTTTIIMSAYLRVLNIYSNQYNIVCTNLSFSGGGKESESERDQFNSKCYEPLMAKNILSITAAGNEREKMDLEGLKAVVVSAMKQSGTEYCFDNSYSNYGKIIDIAAPGSAIMSAGIAPTDSVSSSLIANDGTSMASPQVAGIVALLYLNPNLSADTTASDIEQMLYNNSIDLGSPGKDIYYGHGMINLRYFEISGDAPSETLSFYIDGQLVTDYSECCNYIDAFSLTIECSDPDFTILYTLDRSIPTINNSYTYVTAFEINEGWVFINLIGVKLVGGEIVDRTNLYNISFFNENAPLEDCFDINQNGVLYNYRGNHTNLTIPEIFKGIKVTELGDRTFEFSCLKSIILPDSLTRIGMACFGDCSDLSYVYAPGVYHLQPLAFYNCDSITIVTDGEDLSKNDGVVFLPNLERSASSIFYGCDNLQSVTLTKLSDVPPAGKLFTYCKKITKVSLPALKEIPDACFYGCESLSGTFEIGENVASIGPSAFALTSITGFNIHTGNEYLYTDGIGVYFENKMVACANVEDSKYTILSNVLINEVSYVIDTVQEGASYGMSFKELTIPANITTLEKWAFDKSNIGILNYNAVDISEDGYIEGGTTAPPFENITTIIIGDNVEQIPCRMFYFCSFINLVINSSDTLFSNDCFGNAFNVNGLERLTFNFINGMSESYLNELLVTANLNKREVHSLYSKVEVPIEAFLHFDNLLYLEFDGEYHIYKELVVITALSGSNGSIDPSGRCGVEYGDDQTFTFQPNEGCEIDEIIVDNFVLTGQEFIDAVNTLSYTFYDVREEHSIEVLYKEVVRKIYTTIIGVGEINYSLEQDISYGEQLNYVFTPGQGYVLTKVIIDEEELSNLEFKNVLDNGYTFTGDEHDHTIEVYFDLSVCTITATLHGNGTINQDNDVEIEYGEQITYIFTPEVGYQVSRIIVDGNELDANDLASAIGNGYTFTGDENDHTVEVYFVLMQYCIFATSGANGSMSPRGTVVANYGLSLRFTFTPNAGYNVGSIIVDGVALTGSVLTNAIGNGYTFNNITSNHTIEVTFAIQTFTITVTQSSNGTISPETTTVNYGDSQRFIFTPDTNYFVSGIMVDGVALTGSVLTNAINNGYTFSNVQGNHFITATYLRSIYTITITIIGNGSVAPGTNIEVNYGQSQTIHFCPGNDYNVNSIVIDGSELSGSYFDNAVANGYTIASITNDHDIQVVFVKDEKVITASVEGVGGTISPSGKVLVKVGESHTFNIIPDSDYEISQVIVNNVNQGQLDSYTFNNVQSNQTIKVVFVKKSFVITAISSANGTISNMGNVEYEIGQSANYSFTPNTGYYVESILVDGIALNGGELSNAISNGYTFTNINTNHTISVLFAILKYNINISILGEGVVTLDPEGQAEYSSNKKIYISPADGYYIAAVRIGLAELTSVGIDNIKTRGYYQLYSIKNNYDIVITFEKITYNINVTSYGNGVGNIDPGSDVVVGHGDDCEITFMPEAGSYIKNVFVDGVSKGVITSFTFTNVITSHTVMVEFDVIMCRIIATSGYFGNISPEGEKIVAYGSTYITYTFTPDYGYKVKDVTVNGVSVGSDTQYIFESVTSNQVINVEFEKIMLTIFVNCSANGTINPSGDVLVEFGSSKTFNIQPDSNYAVGYIKLNGTIVDYNNESSITIRNITTDQVLEITFVELFFITASTGEHGSITPSANVPLGGDMRFDFYPHEGYKVKDVKVDEVSVGARSYYIFENVDRSHKISVTFTIKTFNITCSVKGEGDFYTDDILTNVAYGEGVEITIVAKEDWQLRKVNINGESVKVTDGKLVIRNIQDNLNIVIEFEEEVFLFGLDIETIALIIGATIGVILIIAIIVKIRNGAKRRVVATPAPKPTTLTYSPNNIPTDATHAKQDVNKYDDPLTQSALNFVKDKEEQFISFCALYGLDYHNNYNYAAVKYYQAYLRSKKK